MPVQKNQTARSRIDALERRLATYEGAFHDLNRGVPVDEVLERVDDELGEAATTPVSVEAIRAGLFTAEQLADRLPEVEAALTGKPAAGTALTLEAIKRGDFSTEELADRLDEVNALMEGDR